MIGPFTFEIFLHVVNEEAGATGKVVLSTAPGRIPTEEDLHRLFGKALAALPEGFRLMDGEEFFNRVLVKEHTGREGNFAVPAACNFDVEALTAAALAAHKPDEEAETAQAGVNTEEDDGDEE